MKKILKTLGATLVAAYLCSQLILASIIKLGDNNNSRHNLRVAKDLTEYLDYVSTKDINIYSEVHHVIPLQKMLEATGYDIGKCGADGIYGRDISNAVRSFQRDQRLPASGTANTETLKRLIHICLSNPEIYAALNKELIEPFQTTEIQKFMSNVPELLRPEQYKVLLMPDLQLAQLFGGSGDWIDSPSVDEAFGQYKYHTYADAYRHVCSFISLSNSFPTVSPEDVEIGANLQENIAKEPIEVKLTDMYNHHIALGIAYALGSDGDSKTKIDSAVISSIKSGDIMVYPFPIIID